MHRGRATALLLSCALNWQHMHFDTLLTTSLLMQAFHCRLVRICVSAQHHGLQQRVLPVRQFAQLRHVCAAAVCACG